MIHCSLAQNINLNYSNSKFDYDIIFTIPMAIPVYFIIETKSKNSGKLVATMRSDRFKTITGVNSVRSETIPFNRIEYLDSEIKDHITRSGSYPKGKYEICTRVINAETQAEIEKICREVNIGDPLLVGNSKKPIGMIDFYGSASIEGYYMSPTSYYNELPGSYLRVQAEQGVQLYGIPISLEGRYSNEKPQLGVDLNYLRINFDRNRFQAKAKEIVLRKLTESQLQKISKYATELSTLGEIEHAEALIKEKSQEIIEKKIAEAEADLKKYAQAQTAEAQEKYAKLYKTYKSLLRQKQRAMEIKGRYDQLMAIKKEWIDNGKLKELEALAYNPPDLTDPKVIMTEMKKYGLFNGINKMLFNVQELTIGSAFPTYSPLTLNGIQVNGGSISVNPGLLRLSATVGNTQGYSNVNSYLQDGRFSQKVMAARLGIGKDYGSSFNLTGVRFDDKPKADAGLFILPEQVTVGGTDFMLSIGKNRLIEWSGEVAGLARNQNKLDTLAFNYEIINSQSIRSNLSTNYDFAGSSRLGINIKGTRLQAMGQFVGPGFIHPGTFGIRNDMLRKDISLYQSVLKNKLDIGLQYIDERDNFSQSKGITSFLKQYNIHAAVNTSGINTRIQVSKILLNTGLFDYNSNLISANFIKNFNISGSLSGSTMLYGAYYDTKTDSISQNVNSTYLVFNQSLTKGTFSLNFGGQFTQNATAVLTNNMTGVNASIGKSFGNKARIQIGAQYNKTVSTDYRLGFNADIQATILPNLIFTVQANFNDYSQYPESLNGRKEKYAMAGVRYNW